MTWEPQVALDDLKRWIAQFPSALVAYSGGVDSALVMAAAHQQLGDKSLACIGVSPSYPQREMTKAVELARKIGAPFRTVNTDEVSDPRYAANAADRCYYCKTDLYDHLRRIAEAENWAVILDGNNASDLGDDRPGRVAAAEHAVRSPLVELNIAKDQVRAMARQMGLPVWDKPAMACLSSRVPHGAAVSPELLQQIERAEDCLAHLGFKQFRVRHHGDVARVELPAADLPRAVELRQQIVGGISAAGYRHVTLDLAGFRSGSLNGVPLVQLTTPAGKIT